MKTFEANGADPSNSNQPLAICLSPSGSKRAARLGLAFLKMLTEPTPCAMRIVLLETDGPSGRSEKHREQMPCDVDVVRSITGPMLGRILREFGVKTAPGESVTVSLASALPDFLLLLFDGRMRHVGTIRSDDELSAGLNAICSMRASLSLANAA